MRKGPPDVSSCLGVKFIEPLQQFFHILAGRPSCRWAWVGYNRKVHLPGQCLDFGLFHQSQGPDDGEKAFEHFLLWDHGAEFAGIAHVYEEGFYEIIHVVAKDNLVTAEDAGKLKKSFASEHGA